MDALKDLKVSWQCFMKAHICHFTKFTELPCGTHIFRTSKLPWSQCPPLNPGKVSPKHVAPPSFNVSLWCLNVSLHEFVIQSYDLSHNAQDLAPGCNAFANYVFQMGVIGGASLHMAQHVPHSFGSPKAFITHKKWLTFFDPIIMHPNEVAALCEVP